MTPALSLEKSEIKTHSPQTSHCEKRSSFSRPREFVVLLTPVVVAVTFAILFLESKGSFADHVGVLGMLAFGLGTAIWLLSAIRKVEESDERHR